MAHTLPPSRGHNTEQKQLVRQGYLLCELVYMGFGSSKAMGLKSDVGLPGLSAGCSMGGGAAACLGWRGLTIPRVRQKAQSCACKGCVNPL